MNTKLLRRVRQLYSDRSYQLQWVRSIRRLGDNWLLAKEVRRIK